jgi:hypothetical protein
LQRQRELEKEIFEIRKIREQVLEDVMSKGDTYNEMCNFLVRFIVGSKNITSKTIKRFDKILKAIKTLDP